MNLIPGIFRPKKKKEFLASVDDTAGWTKLFDWLPGDWQRNNRYDNEGSVITHPTVYACISRVAEDVGKLKPQIQQYSSEHGIWETKNQPRYLDTLMKPNTYQNHIEFKENWIHSKMIHGNTYCLIVRKTDGSVDGLIILDPTRVTPLVSDMGEVWYRLDPDNLSRINTDQITVPGSEVIHDKVNALFHPLVGLSPLFAASVAAKGGLAILRDTKNFFENGANPAGMLIAPGPIDSDTITRLKEQWKAKYSGDNTGEIAVIGGGMTYQAHKMNATDAQLIEQLKMSSESICSVYHVPQHMVGVGQMPSHDNIEALTQSYYSNCLQIHIEKMEILLAKALDLPKNNRVELDLDSLFRTDTTRKVDVLTKMIAGTMMKPNEARAKMNMMPVEGGDAVYSQQQYFSLAALAARDADDPFAKPEPAPAPSQDEPEDDVEDDIEDDDEEDIDAEEIRSMLLYGIDHANFISPMTSLLRN